MTATQAASEHSKGNEQHQGWLQQITTSTAGCWRACALPIIPSKPSRHHSKKRLQVSAMAAKAAGPSCTTHFTSGVNYIIQNTTTPSAVVLSTAGTHTHKLRHMHYYNVT